jgi:monoamine oxidase
MQAASQIGFGAVVKIMLLFKVPFWKKDSGFILSEEVIPTWWTQLPNTSHILTGWAGGMPAASLSRESKSSILAKALFSLSNIFGIPVAALENNLESFFVANWQKSARAAGAYSYATPHTGAARNLLNKGVKETVYFCGEGIYGGDSPGTVEASIAHALETAGKIKK